MDAGTAVYTDFSGLAELKVKAHRDGQSAASEVARQFESLLMGQMIKAMRQASLADGILDNNHSRFYQDLFDRQLALHLAGHGGMGLAAAIERQLGTGPAENEVAGKTIGDYPRIRLRRPESTVAEGIGSAEQALDGAPQPPPGNGPPRTGADRDPTDWDSEDFVEQLWPWALEAASRLGLQPQALLAQAALETGWGRHIMRRADGTPSYNLFGIKAGRGWRGDLVNIGSLEYEQGAAVKKLSAFRAYDSFRDSFQDYVNFLQSNPRYGEALSAVADSRRYFSSLQAAGYATDPEYAEKIDGVLRGTEMQRALARFKANANQPL
ncbi:MAG: flagellar assembly peptidoglycan hydrolase FlgJ [Gammaproteobacteria bacterium]|nr:flagellar assembly peptidoglycan hydrolase FlgJ [Gammaproteobacteria bacterium]